jgi:hypothetical protein
MRVVSALPRLSSAGSVTAPRSARLGTARPRIPRAFEAAGIADVSRQQDRLLAEVAALRDKVRVQSAVSNPLDTMMGQMLNILTAMLEQIRAMVAQHQRLPTG